MEVSLKGDWQSSGSLGPPFPEGCLTSCLLDLLSSLTNPFSTTGEGMLGDLEFSAQALEQFSNPSMDPEFKVIWGYLVSLSYETLSLGTGRK